MLQVYAPSPLMPRASMGGARHECAGVSRAFRDVERGDAGYRKDVGYVDMFVASTSVW
jgi:hypothetical protein